MEALAAATQAPGEKSVGMGFLRCKAGKHANKQVTFELNTNDGIHRMARLTLTWLDNRVVRMRLRWNEPKAWSKLAGPMPPLLARTFLGVVNVLDMPITVGAKSSTGSKIDRG